MIEDNYRVKERAEAAVKKHGSIKKAIKYLKAELGEFENIWSKYSSDCLGHGITCNNLIISWLERKLCTVKPGDIVRYPLGMHELVVRKVYADKKGDMYVRELINTEREYRRYIYRKMNGYKWDTRLCIELGFGLATKSEAKFLKD
jgi:hypothetical protein